MDEAEGNQEEIARRYRNAGPAAFNATLQKVRIIIIGVVSVVGFSLLIGVLAWAALVRIFPILEEYAHGWVAIIVPVGVLVGRYFWKRTMALLQIESERVASR